MVFTRHILTSCAEVLELGCFTQDLVRLCNWPRPVDWIPLSRNTNTGEVMLYCDV